MKTIDPGCYQTSSLAYSLPCISVEHIADLWSGCWVSTAGINRVQTDPHSPVFNDGAAHTAQWRHKQTKAEVHTVRSNAQISTLSMLAQKRKVEQHWMHSNAHKQTTASPRSAYPSRYLKYLLRLGPRAQDELISSQGPWTWALRLSRSAGISDCRALKTAPLLL